MMHDSSASNPLKILLIEDSVGDAMIISKVLQQAMPQAHLLERASTISEALKIVSEQEFDVALLDRTLPDSHGFNGLHSIQNMSPKLPIIFLTGYKDERLALEAIKQGAQDYLFKDQLDANLIKRAIQYAVLRKQFEDVLIIRANFDMLTGLANRMLFENRLEIALAKMRQLGGIISVLLLDLDKFKQVNDTYGHIAGDKLLKEVSSRLKQSLRSYDVVARFGGDEFAILLENLSDPHQSEIVAKKIASLMDAPFNLSGNELPITLSIGIVNCHNNRYISSESVLLQADAAMYEAKSLPGTSYRVFGSN
ncbi:diguanylate cyclase response regulator [Legionella lytica]|jgi:diguanylate cyclase (GGDEF)-like protein|uniref:Diguanylate cyclase response regulator n=1 Tax=Legionella lytica TaxID=96232 RepID=A0ABY4Y9P2_9GAMM|nr:diguanylate cyclase response regulator [Legionella lytica]USQ14320.1 diguanylate cyclase response regulator [Legionella lytica]